MAQRAILEIDSTEYEVFNFEYEIVQQIKENGQPSARPAGVLIHFVIESRNDSNLSFHKWVRNKNKTEMKNGVFTFEIMIDSKPTYKTISFNNAYCIRLFEHFERGSNMQMLTYITISAAEISFGNNKDKVVFNNDGKS